MLDFTNCSIHVAPCFCILVVFVAGAGCVADDPLPTMSGLDFERPTTREMAELVEAVYVLTSGFDPSSCQGEPKVVIEDLLQGFADRDESGELSEEEMHRLSQAVFTLGATAALTGDEQSSPDAGPLTAEELARLSEASWIQGRLRARCAGDSFVFPNQTLDMLPDHWTNVRTVSIDGTAGCFRSSEVDLRIDYSIGPEAGEIASGTKRFHDEWRREGESDGAYFRYKKSGEYLILTFPGEGPANYLARVENEGEIEYVLELVVKYRNELLASEVGIEPRSARLCER